jgi:hypothetical protein
LREEGNEKNTIFGCKRKEAMGVTGENCIL